MLVCHNCMYDVRLTTTTGTLCFPIYILPFLSFDIFILLLGKSHGGGPVHLKINLVSPKSFLKNLLVRLRGWEKTCFQ